MSICTRCDGERMVSCTACDGKGNMYFVPALDIWESDCPECYGGGMVMCPSCSGSGLAEVEAIMVPAPRMPECNTPISRF